MKHLFIVNPIAGGKDRTEDVKAAAEKIFSALDGEEYEIYVTKGPKDATAEIIRRAENGEEYRIYACGGDGTFNECVCGAAHRENIALTPFPIGTGNDFCRMFGEEKDMFRNLDALVKGGTHMIDLIKCNETYCANICSVGIDARIGVNVHKYSKIPVIGGAGGYVISMLVEIFKGINTRMKIVCNGKETNNLHALACVCNGRYYGGGFNPSIVAMPDDGLLDMYIVRDVKLYQLPILIGRYASGKADEMPEYIEHISSDRISFEFENEAVAQVDGEALYSKKFEMCVHPASLKLIVPEGMKFFENA